MLYPILGFALFLPINMALAEICGATGAIGDGDLLYLPNAWNDDGSGFACVTEDSADHGFESRWSWRNDSKDVHSYSCAKLNSDSLPIRLSAAESLSVNIDWSMSMSGSTNGKTSSSVVANVAFDMFADADLNKASNSTAAAFEFMIWLGSRGAPYPIGYSSRQNNATYSLGSQTFYLYIGTNHRGAQVFSWLATRDIEGVTGDVLPLLTYLVDHNYIDADTYLGTIEFGTEASHSPKSVTFRVPNLDIDISTSRNNSATGSPTFRGISKSSSGWVKQSGASVQTVLEGRWVACAFAIVMVWIL